MAPPLVINRRHEAKVRLDRLTVYPDNPRKGDIDAIAESIHANGFFGSVLVQESTSLILDGNHRYLAAAQEGLTTIPVTWVDVDDVLAKRILLAANRSADLAYYDDETLARLLATFDEDALVGTLYTSADLDVLLASLGDVGDSIGSATDARTPADRAIEFQNSAIRSIILPLTIEDYEATIARLVHLRQAWGLDSNVDVIMRALKLAEDA